MELKVQVTAETTHLSYFQEIVLCDSDIGLLISFFFLIVSLILLSLSGITVLFNQQHLG